MKYLRLLPLVLLIFIVTNCEKKEAYVNETTDVQIVGFVMEKCYCCWGWVIKIGSDTIKTEKIPDLEISENNVFPINAKISIGSKTHECTGTQFDYYEITEFSLLK